MNPRPVDAVFDRRDAIEARVCYRCYEAVDVAAFTDEWARLEWQISGLGECCQAVVFANLGGDTE